MPRILLGLIRSWKHCLIWIEGTQVLLGWDFVYSQYSSMNHTFRYLDSSDGFFEGDHALQSSTKQIHNCSMRKVVDCQVHKAINCGEQTIKPLTACFARRFPQIKEYKQTLFFFFLPLFLSNS